MENLDTENLPEEIVLSKIYELRGVKVMLDFDLAVLYNVKTRDLNKAVNRNSDRFPGDFMFRLTPVEFKNLMFQIGTSSWGGRRKLPNAFTEAGVAMLSSVLNSTRAIKVNVQIIRIFTKLRIVIQSHPEMLRLIEEIQKKDIEQDQQLLLIFEYLKKLERSKQQETEFQERRKIGFSLTDS
jgi:hypothetical protein